MSIKQVSLTAFPSKGAQMPFTATAQVAPLNLFGGNNWQVGGVFSSVIPLVFPAFSGTSTKSFNTSLGFSKFTLPKGASANIFVSVTVASQPTGSPPPIFAVPYLVLNVQGSGVSQSSNGVSQFTLKAGRSYAGFNLTGYVTGYSTSGTTIYQPVYLTVQAMLLGLPPSN